MEDVSYWCSEYGAVYFKNQKLTPAHEINIFINDISMSIFTIPPLSGGIHFIGMVSVPKYPFKWHIDKYIKV